MSNEEQIKRLNELFPYIREYQKLAHETCGIEDIFQDNGGKLLQVLSITGLSNLTDSREGNDAADAAGREYELKSVNIRLTTSVSTNHHTTQDIIDKYRKVDWVIAVYDNIELQQIYLLEPQDLEPYFSKWEKKLGTATHINNPKIPLTYIREKGKLIYDAPSDGSFSYCPIY